MIGRLHGKLLEVHIPEVLLDVNGVGYEVLVPMTTLYQLPIAGNDTTLYTHLAVSETAQTLYGFHTREIRELFRTLIRINGVGPKLGLAILSGLDAQQLVDCVQNNRIAVLTKVPGVGKKTAERLLIELRDKFEKMDALATADADAAPVAGNPAVVNRRDIIAEAEAALVGLGYKPVEASRAVAAVLDEHDCERSEELLRLALKSLMPV